MASQHGLDSLATDVAAVKACLARVSSPAILVGHSYGGTLITHAGTDPRVARLVYIAALAPDADETSQGQLDKFREPLLEATDGRVPVHAIDLQEIVQRARRRNKNRRRRQPRTGGDVARHNVARHCSSDLVLAQVVRSKANVCGVPMIPCLVAD